MECIFCANVLTKLVWLVGPDGGDGKVDVLKGCFVVQLNVKMLVWNQKCCIYISMIHGQFIWPLLWRPYSTSPLLGLPPFTISLCIITSTFNCYNTIAYIDRVWLNHQTRTVYICISNSAYLSCHLWLVRLATQDTFTALSQITVCARLTGSSSKHTEQPKSPSWAFNTCTTNLDWFHRSFWIQLARLIPTQSCTDHHNFPQLVITFLCPQNLPESGRNYKICYLAFYQNFFFYKWNHQPSHLEGFYLGIF